MNQTFPIAPAGVGTLVTVAILTTVILALVILFGGLLYSARHVAFTVTDTGVTVTGDIYGRTIPLADLLVGQASIKDLATDPEFGLRWRTNGVGLPGYRSGWFRLKNGDKALIFVTDKEHVVTVPTTQGYTLMMSPRDPAAMLADLQNFGG